MWTLKLMFAGVLQEALTFGIAAITIAVLLLAAWFVPSVRLKRVCLSLAAAVGIATFAYGVGVQHEYDRRIARERVLERQADEARQRAERTIPTVVGDPPAPDCQDAHSGGKPSDPGRPKRVPNRRPLDRLDRSGWK